MRAIPFIAARAHNRLQFCFCARTPKLKPHAECYACMCCKTPKNVVSVCVCVCTALGRLMLPTNIHYSAFSSSAGLCASLCCAVLCIRASEQFSQLDDTNRMQINRALSAARSECAGKMHSQFGCCAHVPPKELVVVWLCKFHPHTQHSSSVECGVEVYSHT